MTAYTDETLCQLISDKIDILSEKGKRKTFIPSVAISKDNLRRAKMNLSEAYPTLIMEEKKCPRGWYDIILEWKL